MTSTASTNPSALPPQKARYRVTNWAEYDRALVARGDIIVWFDPEAIEEKWTPAPAGRRGAPVQYSDWAIQAMWVLKQVLHLPFRAVEGFGRSLMGLMGLDKPIPDHTHLSRRARRLTVQIPRKERTKPVHLVVDSTGVKVWGEGEWKVRQHGVSKRRTWLKVHLAVDATEQDVIGLEVTTLEGTDAELFGGLVAQVEGTIDRIAADGAYDTREAYEMAVQRGANLVVPPRENAVPWEADHPRTRALAAIQAKGRRQWKQDAGYHRRSLAETAMYRFKQLLGDRLASRRFESQVNEIHARIAALNAMTYLGMPVSVRVGVTAS
jgi:Transposase DDE domain